MPDYSQIEKVFGIENQISSHVWILIDSHEHRKTAKIQLTELIKLISREAGRPGPVNP